MDGTVTCKARQCSDQMHCASCGNTWDMNDQDPPACKAPKELPDEHVWPEPCRAALGVRRWHTWPTIQTQTTADHSLHVLRIYCKLFGAPPPHVTFWIIHHDTPEYITGDIPFHAKALGGREFKLAIESVEDAGMEKQLPSVWRQWKQADKQLHRIERWRTKVCDLMDMLEFSLMEIRLGNKMFEGVLARVGEALEHHTDTAYDLGVNTEDIQNVLFYANELAEAER